MLAHTITLLCPSCHNKPLTIVSKLLNQPRQHERMYDTKCFESNLKSCILQVKLCVVLLVLLAAVPVTECCRRVLNPTTPAPTTLPPPTPTVFSTGSPTGSVDGI